MCSKRTKSIVDLSSHFCPQFDEDKAKKTVLYFLFFWKEKKDKIVERTTVHARAHVRTWGNMSNARVALTIYITSFCDPS
jgi:hypothetical protein